MQSLRRLGSFLCRAPLLVLAIALPSVSAYAAVHLTVDPTSLDFGQHAFSETTDLTIHLINDGDVALEVDRLVLSGVAAADYSIVSPPQASFPVVIATGTTLNVIVRFTPGANGDRKASLSVESSIGSFLVALSGFGLGDQNKLEFALSSIDFGKIAPNAERDSVIRLYVTGTGSASLQTLQVSNSSGDIDFEADLVDPGLSFPLEIAAGDSVAIVIHFFGNLPEDVKSGSLKAFTDGGAAANCDLSGEVIWGAAAFSLPNIDFGDMYVGEVRDTTVDLINTGEVDISLIDVQLNSTVFFDRDATVAPLGVEAGARHTFRIQAVPKVPGPAFSQLQTVSRTTTPTFRSVDIRANVLPMPLTFSSIDTLHASCATAQPISFSSTVSSSASRQYFITNIAVEDSGVTISLPSVPVTIDAGSNAVLQYSVDPATIPSRGFFVIDYLGGDQMLHRDTVYVVYTALQALTALHPSPGLDRVDYGVRLSDVTDETAMSTLVITIRSTHTDRLSIDRSSIALAPAYSGDALSIADVPDGYEATITSNSPMSIDPNVDILTFAANQFLTAVDSGRIVASVTSPEWDGCLTFTSAEDSASGIAGCGTGVLQQYLSTGSVTITGLQYTDRAHASLEVQAKAAASVSLLLSSLTGEVVWHHVYEVGRGANTLALQTSNLSSGSYVGSVSAEGRPIGSIRVQR